MLDATLRRALYSNIRGQEFLELLASLAVLDAAPDFLERGLVLGDVLL